MTNNEGIKYSPPEGLQSSELPSSANIFQQALQLARSQIRDDMKLSDHLSYSDAILYLADARAEAGEISLDLVEAIARRADALHGFLTRISQQVEAFEKKRDRVEEAGKNKEILGEQYGEEEVITAQEEKRYRDNYGTVSHFQPQVENLYYNLAKTYAHIGHQEAAESLIASGRFGSGDIADIHVASVQQEIAKSYANAGNYVEALRVVDSINLRFHDVALSIYEYIINLQKDRQQDDETTFMHAFRYAQDKVLQEEARDLSSINMFSSLGQIEVEKGKDPRKTFDYAHSIGRRKPELAETQSNIAIARAKGHAAMQEESQDDLATIRKTVEEAYSRSGHGRKTVKYALLKDIAGAYAATGNLEAALEISNGIRRSREPVTPTKVEIVRQLLDQGDLEQALRIRNGLRQHVGKDYYTFAVLDQRLAVLAAEKGNAQLARAITLRIPIEKYRDESLGNLSTLHANNGDVENTQRISQLVRRLHPEKHAGTKEEVQYRREVLSLDTKNLIRAYAQRGELQKALATVEELSDIYDKVKSLADIGKIKAIQEKHAA